MNNKLRFIEVLFMLALILAFATTGIFIIQEKNDYAMLSLTTTSFIALIEFYLVLTGHTGKVIDLRGATNRNPKGAYATNDYSDPLFEEDYNHSGKSVHSLEAAKSRPVTSKAITGSNKKRAGKTTTFTRGTTGYERTSREFLRESASFSRDSERFSRDSERFSSEGVGNMRVYQRGEKIDYVNSEDSDEDW